MSDRYSRQILFAEIGPEGQKKLASSSAVLIGCGALGTVTAELLVRAGVGHIDLIDRDYVEESNLQRQALFTEEDARLGLPKAIAAERTLRSINSEVKVRGVIQDVTWENIDRLCRSGHVIVDGTDNFGTRFLINDYSVSSGLPWIYGACVASHGLAFAFEPGKTPCLQCLLEDPPPVGSAETCDTAGILGPVVHVISAFQALQAIKLLVGRDPDRQMLKVDLWEGLWKTILAGRARSESCACCGKGEFRFLQGEELSRSTRLCGRNAVQVSPPNRTPPDFRQISRRLGRSAQIDQNEYLMRISVAGYRIALFTDGRSIIQGTEDLSEARSVYAKYIGM